MATGVVYRGGVVYKMGCGIHCHIRYVLGPYSGKYSTGYIIRNRKSVPGWISYLREGAFYTNFNITTPEFFFCL